MPLASKDGKLYVKDGKLCTSCCNQGSAGACCFLNDLGEYECKLTSESRCNELGGNWYEDEECKSEDNPDGIDCSDPSPSELGCCYVDIGDGTLQSQGRTTKRDCQASQDEVDPSIECTWIADTEETKDQPCPDQPVYPPVPGICLYREDGLGTCWGYDTTDGELLPTDLFATEEEAQAYIDSGGCPDNDPSAPECAKCYCYPAEVEGAPPETSWGVIQECVVYTEELDEQGNWTGNYICEKGIYLSDCTEDDCEKQAAANPDAGIEWRNDKPADKCKTVNSEDECTESTGVFCPNVESCPEDPSEGCPETPIRSNPLP